MPEHFDPAWEYWEPDPEIEEVLYGQRHLGLLDTLDLNHREAQHNGVSTGFRFGDPNGFWGRLAREKPEPYKEPKPLRFCKFCGGSFAHRHGGHFFCSVRCAREAYSRQPTSIVCLGCAAAFVTRNPDRVFCSRDCYGEYKSQNKTARFKDCARCGTAFPKTNSRRSYCSTGCRRAYAVRVIPDRPCLKCGAWFRPLKPERRYCCLKGRPRKEDMPREHLPERRRSWTAKAKIPDASGKLMTFFASFGEYPDGRLGEVWIDAAKEGSFVRGVLGSLARMTSLALQSGVTVGDVANTLRGITFPPQGKVQGSVAVDTCTSVADWIAQEIESAYVDHPKGVDVHSPQPPLGEYNVPDKKIRIIDRGAPNSSG